jgi:hypothetical protein
MHLTNFHFYNPKNNLYSKPVKGLQGYGVGYGFSFNGQEKDDEVSGAGNTMTATFWEYDARLGRRWNVDPVVKIEESPYLCFNGNPILIRDENGDDGGAPAVNATEAGLIFASTQEAAAAVAPFMPPLAVAIEIVGTSWAVWELVKDAKLPEHKVATPTATLPPRNIPWPKLKPMPPAKKEVNNETVEQPKVVMAKNKRGRQSERQEEVRHGGPSEGVKGKGPSGDQHTKRKPGDLGEKKRQKKGWKQR